MRRNGSAVRCVAIVAIAGCRAPSAAPQHPDRSDGADPNTKPLIEQRRPGGHPRTEPAPSSAPAAAPSCPGDSDCPSTFEPLALRDEDLARIRRVQPIVRRAAHEYGLEPNLVNALIWVESKFQPRARGPAGARGMMQLMPRTSQSLAKKLGRPHRPYDPEFNIFAGSYYLARLIEKFDGDVQLALAGYNRGAGRVKALVSNGEPLPDGTQRFIRKILRAKATFDERLEAESRSPA
jgi:soluble lytic murein transglycosylase-like protein